MTEIFGGVLAIGEPHALRGGINNASTVLVLRVDKRSAWRLVSRQRFSTQEPRSPSVLLLADRTEPDYNFRYAITDALIWFCDYDKLGIDIEMISELRSYRRLGEVAGDEESSTKLRTAREFVEPAHLDKTISLFLSLATGDQPLMRIPPLSDHAEGLVENLKNLSVQYELSVPLASRLTSGMDEGVREETYKRDGGDLKLFKSDKGEADDGGG